MASAGIALAPAADAVQERANHRIWAQGDLVAVYSTRELRPVEVLILVRYRDALRDRVLELGCGAGRLTGYLAEIARVAHGIDVSAAMVAAGRRDYPKASFSERDLMAISDFEPGSYDAVVAGYNVIDVFGAAERGRVLDRIFRVLAPGGQLIMSSHNLAYAPSIGRPWRMRFGDPLRLGIDLARLPRRMRNRRRMLRFQHVGPDHAILNDEAHDYALLHHYITRDAQERQLEQHGFTLVECLDLEGRPVEAGQQARGCSELHYVARRRG